MELKNIAFILFLVLIGKITKMLIINSFNVNNLLKLNVAEYNNSSFSIILYEIANYVIFKPFTIVFKFNRCL